MTRLGRYEPTRLLGEGGQGRVWEATFHGPAGMRRTVALKVVRDARGLQREARLGGLLRHRHLVDVYEVGEQDGAWFLAMEYCPDGTLAARAPLPARAVVEVGLQVCSALAYAHRELGLVHLDLKPANLLLDGATVKVADLGVARTRESAPAHAQGTPGYVAPELLRGDPVDARADVYALGVVLRELWTGRRRAALPTVPLVQLPSSGPGPPADDDPLARVLDRCTADEPEDRFPSMDALAAALGALAPGGPSLRDVVAPDPPPRAQGGEPARHGELLGRDALLAGLAAALERPGALALVGIGGIGKSHLAREAALAWRERTGGPAWIVECAEVRTRLELVQVVASALDTPLAAGDDAALAAQLGRALSARCRCVLVLDGFEAAEDGWVADLVACAPEARVLVTRRRAVAGLAWLEVGPLSEADAVALLARVALQRGVETRHDPLLPAIARGLDGVPLALVLAAGRLGVLSTQDVVDRLSPSFLHSAEASVLAALSWSWELLDAAARDALARLSVFRGGATPEAASEVLPGDAAGALDRLADASLVRFAPDRQRLEILRIVRDFAASQLAPSDRAAAEDAHGRWFARLVHADGRVADAERENLVAACERAVARGDAEVARDTCLAALSSVFKRGPVALGLSLVEAVLPLGEDPRLLERAGTLCLLAGRATDGLARVEAATARDPGVGLHSLGVLLRHLGRTDEARDAFERAVALHRAAGDAAAEGTAWASLGDLQRQLGDIGAAQVSLPTALGLLRRAGERTAEGATLGKLGVLHRQLGRMDLALGCLEEAVRLHREDGDQHQEAIALAGLGVLHMEEGRRAMASACYVRSLEMAREIGDRRGEAALLGNLAIVQRDDGDLALARQTALACLDAYRSVADPLGEAVALSNLGTIAHQQEALDEARAWLESSVALHRAARSHRGEGIALANLGRLEVDAGRHDDARARFDEALARHRSIGDPRLEGGVLLSLAASLLATRETDAAERHLSEAERLLSAHADAPRLAQAACLRARLHAARGDRPAAVAALARARALAQGPAMTRSLAAAERAVAECED